MTIRFSFSATLLLIFSCSSNQDEQLNDDTSSIVSHISDSSQEVNFHPDSMATEHLTKDQFTSQIYFTEGQGWGYKIFLNGEQYINQPHVPAVQGIKGFDSEIKAKKTADFTVLKMENGIVPPTISRQELDSLGVL